MGLTNVRNYSGILKNTQLKIKAVDNPSENYYVIKAVPTKEMDWKAGQFVVLQCSGYGMKPFSIASISDEGYLLFSTRVFSESSSFKRHIINLKDGDTIKARGPIGSFQLKDTRKPIVLIAMGIGITPIRAILKEIEKQNISVNVHLVYVAKYHMFTSEINDISRKHKNVEVSYCLSREEAIKKQLHLANKYKNEAYYYISGAPKSVRDTKKNLRLAKIDKHLIISDPFIGYKEVH